MKLNKHRGPPLEESPLLPLPKTHAATNTFCKAIQNFNVLLASSSFKSMCNLLEFIIKLM